MADITYLYGFRIFWALFLGIMLICTFYRSWRIENRGRDGRSSQEYTFVGLDPILFPIMIVFYLFLYGIVAVKDRSEKYIVNVSFDIFLFISMYFILLLMFLPLLRKYYLAKTCAAFWIIPVLLFYQPNMLYSRNMALPPKVFLYIPWDVLRFCFYIWMAGAVVILVLEVILHIRYTRMLSRNSRPVDELQMTELWEKMTKEMGLSYSIGLRYCSAVSTPLSVGMRKNKMITYLPEKIFTEEEDIRLIFHHELNHIRRRDTHTKFFLRFCTALGWFHPLVWIAVKKAEADLELSCDEAVLRDADQDTRKRYADLLLTTAGGSKGFTTCLSATAETLRYRLRATVKTGKKKSGIVLLFMVTFLSCLSIGNIAISTERETLIKAVGLEASEGPMYGVTYVSGDEEFLIKDTESLMDYLSQIQVECLLTEYEILDEDESYIYGKSATCSFFIYDDFLKTMETKDGGTYEFRLYHICSEFDKEDVKSFS